MYLLNGQKINIDAPMTLGGVQYPAGHFRDAEARAAAGIVEAPDPTRPDERYYFVTDDAAGNLTATPRDIDQLKAMRCEEIKAIARGKILAYMPEWKQANNTARMVELNWKVTGGTALTPAEQAEADALQAAWDNIKAIRTASNANEALVNACQAVPALQAVHESYSWPAL